jgi:hypothetical protein
LSAIISKSSNFSFPLSNSIKSKESDFKSTQSNRFGFSNKKAPNLIGMGLCFGRDPGGITLARFPRDLFIASKNQTAAHFLVFLFSLACQHAC